MLRNKITGFTLLEILVALFIFTIVSMMMVTVLHSVLTAESSTAKNSENFNQLQMAMILMQQDMEQIVDRPILKNTTEQAALQGSSTDIQLTRSGISNPFGVLLRSSMQRIHYFLRNNQLIRETWPALDIVQNTLSSERIVLNYVTELRFQYLDSHGKFQSTWPMHSNQHLARAIRISITLQNRGTLSQLYFIPVQTSEIPN